MISKIISWDTSLFNLINHNRSVFLDWIMAIFSNSLFMAIIAIFVVFFMLWQRKFDFWYIYIIFIIITFALSDRISVVCFKYVFCRLRPSHALTDSITLKLQHGDLIHWYKGGKYGFVSSHASNIFSLIAFVILSLKSKRIPPPKISNTSFKVFIICILFWGIITGYSRVYCGFHYPTDVLCGGLLGGLIGWGTYYFCAKLIWKLQNKRILKQL